VSAPLSDRMINDPVRGMSQSKALRVSFWGPYLRIHTWIWRHLPASLRSKRSLRGYGSHVHSLIQLRERTQSTGTFFFRNRPELELLVRLLDQFPHGSTIDMAILGCSKGAEVYSFSYTIRTKRPDLNLRLSALDISREPLEIAEAGVYPLDAVEPSQDRGVRSIFERMSSAEMEDLFEQDGENARVRAQFRNGITWRLGDAGDPSLIRDMGPQDIVVANRFLCHMPPSDAEACLRNLARLVKGGGRLFVSGVDLAVRSKVASEQAWRPVTDLIEEVHEGDPTLRRDWPLHYWGLEPLDRSRADWRVRYASIFELPGGAQQARSAAS
jgi:chemotaxis methyl-accepting protein methylase